MANLKQMSPAPWPRSGGWLVPGVEYQVEGATVTWLEYLIVRRVQRDAGILEQPLGSNRGTRIDAMVRRAGAPLGSFWCGCEVGAVWRDCGAAVPDGYAAVDAWLPFLTGTMRPGSAVVYGPSRADGTHIGIVTRTAIGAALQSPQGFQALTIEGNRGYSGSHTNNGLTVDSAPLLRGDVLGFVAPVPVPGWTLAQYAPPDFLLEHWPSLPKPERAASLAKIRAALGLVETAT